MPDETKHSTALGLTSRWTAGVRASESRREDRLFNDPWAELLAGELGAEWAEHQSGDNGISIIVRTRFFDDFLQRVVQEHAIRQVVLLAAGMDTRAFRLAWPERTRFFELDQPQVLVYKEGILQSAGAQARCERHTLTVDLREPWAEALINSGFEPRQAAVWLLEGFLHYLPSEGVERVLNDVTQLAVAGSWLGFDTVNSAMLTSQWTRQWVAGLADLGTPWLSTMDEPEAVLAQHGWQATAIQPGEKEANYGRWPYPSLPRTMPNMPWSWFVTAQKQ
jgi:methyltransferase (TIGR00027 family)